MSLQKETPQKRREKLEGEVAKLGVKGAKVKYAGVLQCESDY